MDDQSSQPDYIRAHVYSSQHRDQILTSELCGCFYCLRIFAPTEIVKWVDKQNGVGVTALCPFCQIDSVIGSKTGFPITESFLQSMQQYWFRT